MMFSGLQIHLYCTFTDMTVHNLDFMRVRCSASRSLHLLSWWSVLLNVTSEPRKCSKQSRLEERAKILKVLNISPSGDTGKRCTEAQINSLTRFTSSLVTEDSKSIITHQCEKNKRVKNVLKVAAMNPEQPSLNWADITFGRCLPWYTLLVYIRVVWLTWDHNKLITACSFIYKKHGRHKSFATMNNWNSYINCVSLTKQNLYMEHKTNMVRTAAGVCFSCRLNICLTFPTSKYWTYIKVHQSFKTEDLIFWPFVVVYFI